MIEVIVNIIRKLLGYKFPHLGKTINNLFFKLISDQIYCEIFPNIHINLSLKDLTQQSTFWMGDRFEYPTSHIIRKWGGNSECLFFDIGANYGFYSYLVCSYFEKRVKCYAFEPNPKTFSLLLETIKKNDLLNTIIPENIGLSNKIEKLILHPGINDSGHSTFLPHPELKKYSTEPIELKTFDIWRIEKKIKLPPNPKWIVKIDVEGLELNVLQGMVNSLKNQSFIGIVIEVLDYTLSLNYNKSSDIEQILNYYGYRKITKQEILSIYRKINTMNSFFVPINSFLF